MTQWVPTASLRAEDFSRKWIYVGSSYSLVMAPNSPEITLPREFASVTVHNWVYRDNIVYVRISLRSVEEAEILRQKLSMMTNSTNNVVYQVTCYYQNQEHCTFTAHAV